MSVRDFTKCIQAGRDFYPEFFFHVLHTALDELRYHISIRDQRGENIFFTMHQNANGEWKIINAPKVPDWIILIEKKLAQAIVEKNNNSSASGLDLLQSDL